MEAVVTIPRWTPSIFLALILLNASVSQLNYPDWNKRELEWKKTEQTPSVNTIPNLGYRHNNKEAGGQCVYSHNIALVNKLKMPGMEKENTEG